MTTPASPTHSARRKLKFGLILTGVGGGGGGSANLWRHPDVPIDASVSIDWHVRQAREAEESLFDFVFVTDSQYIEPTYPNHHLNRLEPLTLLSAVAIKTRRIGLAATVTTSYAQPWDTARRLASLDLISNGRASWNIVTSFDAGTAGNFGLATHGGYEERYARAREAVDVVKSLWDSYEDDGFARDKTAERYFDPTKQHRLDHVGTYYSVTGPLNVQRSPQGQPVLVQAGTSEQGRDLSAYTSEIVFSFAQAVEWHRELVHDVRARAERYGRSPQDILFLPALSVLIRDTDEQARAAEQAHKATFPLEGQFNRLKRQFPQQNFSLDDLDNPLPALGIAAISSAEERFNRARENGASLREVLQDMHYHHAHFIGAPESIADQIEHWYREGLADGFNLFSREPEENERFYRDVLPILQRRGLFREAYEGDTLRANLELPIPENRYTLESRNNVRKTST